MAKILFFSPIDNLSLFEKTGFYATDIRLLKEVGHEVITTNSLKTVLTENYDFLFSYFYTWSAFAVAIARFRGKPTLMTGGADLLDPTYNRSRKKYLLHCLLYRFGYFFSSKILAVSKKDLENLSKLGGNKKLSLTPHVVDTSFFTPSKNQKSNNLLSIGWMGTIENVQRKGMDSAVKLLAELKAQNFDAKLVIAGTPGPGTEYLMKLADDLGLSNAVDFKYSISETEKLALLQSSKYYLQLSEFEGFGLAALEALSCGACVIHTGRGGLTDFMEDFGLTQPWPLKINNIAKEIITHNNKDIEDTIAAYSRHLHVAKNFSLTRRRKAFENLIHP
jgi:glycosyltransferase involved in cell wall biosynthesis